LEKRGKDNDKTLQLFQTYIFLVGLITGCVFRIQVATLFLLFLRLSIEAYVANRIPFVKAAAGLG